MNWKSQRSREQKQIKKLLEITAGIMKTNKASINQNPNFNTN